MSEDVLNPHDSGERIAKNAKHVFLNSKKIGELAKKLLLEFKSDRYSLKNWKEHELHPKTANVDSIHWILLADSLNYSFWPDNPKKKYGVKFKGKLHSGWWTIHAAIRRAQQEGIPITDVNYFANMTYEELKYFLRSDTDEDIPLLQERHKTLTEAGQVVLKKFDGSFENCLIQSDHSAQKLLKLIVENFSSYRDEAEYEGVKVSFYKRAQILIADLWALFEGEGLGYFHDIDSLTMFADYRVPQVLVYFGAMSYSDELMQKIKEGELAQGGHYEVEIRGCSIATVEYLSDEMKSMANAEGEKNFVCNSSIIDYCLWDYRRLHAHEIEVRVPFHKTRCIYY